MTEGLKSNMLDEIYNVVEGHNQDLNKYFEQEDLKFSNSEIPLCDVKRISHSITAELILMF